MTILVVEDDEDTRELYELILVAAGYQVLGATSGEAALARAAAHPVDGVVLDRRLPDMDGVAVCRDLREQLSPTTPIIMVTADLWPGSGSRFPFSWGH